MSGVLLSLRAPFPTEDTPENWMLWAMNASDQVLDRFRELQKPNLLADALYAACMTVIYNIPIGKFPFGIVKEDIMLQDVVMAAGSLLTVPVMRGLLSISPQFSSPDESLVRAVHKTSITRGMTLKQFVYSLGIDYDRIETWVVLGDFLPPSIRNHILANL